MSDLLLHPLIPPSEGEKENICCGVLHYLLNVYVRVVSQSFYVELPWIENIGQSQATGVPPRPGKCPNDEAYNSRLKKSRLSLSAVTVPLFRP